MLRRKSVYLSLLVTLALLLAACVPVTAPVAEAPAASEAVATEAPLAEAPLAEAPLAEAEATEPAPEEAAEEAAAPAVSDVTEAVSAYLAGIPEGWMAVGQLDAFKAALDTGAVVLIDVREPGEYEAGHIPGAINIPIRTLAQNLDKIPTDQPVIVYCASGHRAGMSTSALEILGYSNVRSYPPGWRGWTAAEEPVSTDPVEGETYDVPAIAPDLLAAVDDYLSNIPEGFYSLGTPEKLAEAMDAGAVVIDVRQESEYAEGAIPTAINIPLRTLGEHLDLIPMDQPVVVYCASGHRAALAAAALHTMGYSNVRSFPPGYPGWEAAQGESGELPSEPAAAAPATDVVAVVDAYLQGIPDGFMTVGSLDTFKEMIASANPLLIDVREPGEYEAGHIEGAINIPIRTLAQNLDKIPTDRPVAVYCASGHRAGMATSALRVLGYGNVKAFPPGWKGWTGANEPVSTDPVEPESGTAPDIDPAVLAAVDGFLSNIPEGFYALGQVDQLAAAMDIGATVVDVREEGEYADGHIAGALSIPIRTLGQHLDQIPTDAPVVVYCASGFRAALSTAALQIMDYTNAHAFPPSYGGWEAAGQPVE